MTAVTELESTPYEDFGPAEHRAPLNSLVAAGKRLNRKTLKRAGNSGKAEAWQEDAWDMYDLVGEQRFLATTLANRLAQARFFVGKLPKDSTEDIVPVTEGPAYEAFQSMIGKGEHFKQMVARIGLNLFIPGDGYLLGCPKDRKNGSVAKQPAITARNGISPFGADEPEVDPITNIVIADLEWQMHSISELSINSDDGEITVTGGSGGDAKVKHNADNVVLIRIWRPHPRRWWQADSPTRSSLPVLRELVGLTMKISANIDSRLAGSGVLFVPASADAALRAAAGATGTDDLSPFAEALMDAMITPITDRSSASSVVPLMPVVPDESIEKFRWMENPNLKQDPEDRAQRDEAIRRLALGQDCPPELLLGVAGMNHWGAWLVREDVVTTHLEPPLALICDAITTQFIWPVLEQQDNLVDFNDYVIWYDVDHMIQRPNRSQDAKDAKSLGIISDAAARDSLGFDETDAPPITNEKTDPVIELVLSMLSVAPTLAVNPGLPVLAAQVRALLEGKDQNPPNDNPPSGVQAAAPTDAQPPEEQPTEGGTPATQDAPAQESTIDE